jgi:hypothetical protein
VTAPEVLEEVGACVDFSVLPLELEEPDEDDEDVELLESVVDEVEPTVDTFVWSMPAVMPIAATTASPPVASTEVTRRTSRRPLSRLRAASSLFILVSPFSRSLNPRLRGEPEKCLNAGLAGGENPHGRRRGRLMEFSDGSHGPPKAGV